MRIVDSVGWQGTGGGWSVLEAYGRVATVFAQVARDLGRLDESRTWALRAGTLARECTDVAPERFRCWERLADASVDLSFMAIDALDGPGALRRQLVAALTLAQRRNDAAAAAEAWRLFARALDGAK